MAGLRSAAFMSAVLSGIDEAGNDFRAIQEAKAKKAQNKELFDLKVKKSELEIQEAETSGSINRSVASFMRDRLKNQKSAQKANSTLADDQIEDAETQTKSKAKQLGAIFETGLESMAMDNIREDFTSAFPGLQPSGSSRTGFGVKFDTRTKKNKKKVTEAGKVRGAIIAGGDDITTREEATNTALKRLGANFKTDFPEVQGTIDEKFPDPKSSEFIQAIKRIHGDVKSVRVKLPDGQVGSIPIEQLEVAVRKGARIVEQEK